MSFIRPDAAATLLRWREALIGGGCLALGLWWAFGTRGLLPYLGYALITLGLLLVVAGLQRGRFRNTGQGPGLLRITEDQITYFGPLSGGTIALSDLTELRLDRSGQPHHWVLSQPMEADLFIPVTTDGAEALFDAFSRLPGLRTEHMLAQLQEDGATSALIWTRTQDKLRLN